MASSNSVITRKCHQTVVDFEDTAGQVFFTPIPQWFSLCLLSRIVAQRLYKTQGFSKNERGFQALPPQILLRKCDVLLLVDDEKSHSFFWRGNVEDRNKVGRLAMTARAFERVFLQILPHRCFTSIADEIENTMPCTDRNLIVLPDNLPAFTRRQAVQPYHESLPPRSFGLKFSPPPWTLDSIRDKLCLPYLRKAGDDARWHWVFANVSLALEKRDRILIGRSLALTPERVLAIQDNWNLVLAYAGRKYIRRYHRVLCVLGESGELAASPWASMFYFLQ